LSRATFALFWTINCFFVIFAIDGIVFRSFCSASKKRQTLENFYVGSNATSDIKCLSTQTVFWSLCRNAFVFPLVFSSHFLWNEFRINFTRRGYILKRISGFSAFSKRYSITTGWKKTDKSFWGGGKKRWATSVTSWWRKRKQAGNLPWPKNPTASWMDTSRVSQCKYLR